MIKFPIQLGGIVFHELAFILVLHFGELSPGMQTEIAYAAEHQIPIRYFPAEQEDHFDD